MSTLYPVRVGSDPSRDPPESQVEVTLTLEHHRDLSPAQMEAAAAEAAGRVNDALSGVDFDDLPLMDVNTDVVWRLRNPGPLFPMRMGGSLFTCRLDVEEAIERLCAGTDLQNLAHDSTGRAYEVHVRVTFSRARGTRAGSLPVHEGREAD